jgi:hypothetical protein
MSSSNPLVLPSIVPCRAQQILADLKEKRKNLAEVVTQSLNQKVHQDKSQQWNTTCLKPPPSPSTSVLAQMSSTRANEIMLDMKRKKMALSQTIMKTSSCKAPVSSSQNSYTIRRTDYTSPTVSTAATSMSWPSSNNNHHESFSISDSSLNEKSVNQETALEFYMDDSETFSLTLGNPRTHCITETTDEINPRILPNELIALRQIPTTWETSGRERRSLENDIAMITSNIAVTKNSKYKTDTNGSKTTEINSTAVAESRVLVGDESKVSINGRIENKALLREMLQTVEDIRNRDGTPLRTRNPSMKRQTRSQSPLLPSFLETNTYSSSFNKPNNDFPIQVSTPKLASLRDHSCVREQSNTTLRSSDAVSANSQGSRRANVACHYILPVTPKPLRRRVYTTTNSSVFGTNLVTTPLRQKIPIEQRKSNLVATNLVTSLPRMDRNIIKEKVLHNSLSKPYFEEVTRERTFSSSLRYQHLETKKSSDDSGKRRSSSNKRRSKAPRELPDDLIFVTITKPSTWNYSSSGASITSDVSSLSCPRRGQSKEAKQLEERLDAIIAARKATIKKATKSPKMENIADRWCGGLYHIAVRSGMNGVGEQEI